MVLKATPPSRANQIETFERKQERAAKFVLQGPGHGSEKVKLLGLDTLQIRRERARLHALFKGFAGQKPWQTIRDRMKEPTQYERTDHIFKRRARLQNNLILANSYS